MKLDLDELKRGIDEVALGKEANEAMEAAVRAAVKTPQAKSFIKETLPNAAKWTYNNVPGVKQILSPFRLIPPAIKGTAYGAAGYGTVVGAGTAAEKGWLGEGPRRFVGGSKNAIEAANNIVGAVSGSEATPTPPAAPGTTDPLPFQKAVEVTKGWRDDGVFPWLKNVSGYNTVDNFIQSALGPEVGKHVLPAGLGALGAFGLGKLLFGGKKKRRFNGGGGNAPININIGGQGRLPGLLDYSGNVGSLSSPSTLKYGSEKNAAIIDVLANATKNRVANQLIDKAIASKQPEVAEVKEKELEIVSKYPEMAKLLEDEQNKAYLQKLMKE